MQPATEVQITIQKDLEKNNTEHDDISQSNLSNAIVPDSEVISNNSPMLLANLNKILESNNKKKGQSLIFKRNFKNVAENLILDSYHEMMKSKPIWTACIRESRSIGFISITIKTDPEVVDARFGFIDGQWQYISGKQLDDHNTNTVKLKNKKIFRNTIAGGCQGLLNCIFAKYPQLTIERFILPSPEEKTVADPYDCYRYDYTPVVVTETKIHNNPVDILVNIAALLDKILSNFEVEIKNEDVNLLQKYFSIMQYSGLKEQDAALKECFYNWLESKKLHHDVTSSISLSLLDKPRVLDSGHVVSKEDLMHGDHPIERCPMTREIISTTPFRLPSWETNLKLCLDRFTQLLNKFDEKAIIIEPEPIETNSDKDDNAQVTIASSLPGAGLLSAGFFAASNEGEQTSSQNNNSSNSP